jgi:hypothetical protein
MPETEISTAAPPQPGGFKVKDCALLAIGTGRKAVTLPEFRDGLQAIDPASIYYHFWGALLHPRFEEREYNNDFASWMRHGLHDAHLAERMAVVDPTDYPELESLRQDLVDLVEERLDESEHLSWARATQAFEFMRSQIVVFDTRNRLDDPDELAELIPHLSTGSIFYHFIDARRRVPVAQDDFSVWLSGLDGEYDELIDRLGGIDPYFGSLAELREQLADAFAECFPRPG